MSNDERSVVGMMTGVIDLLIAEIEMVRLKGLRRNFYERRRHDVLKESI